jgi:hypothetical protein
VKVFSRGHRARRAHGQKSQQPVQVVVGEDRVDCRQYRLVRWRRCAAGYASRNLIPASSLDRLPVKKRASRRSSERSRAAQGKQDPASGECFIRLTGARLPIQGEDYHQTTASRRSAGKYRARRQATGATPRSGAIRYALRRVPRYDLLGADFEHIGQANERLRHRQGLAAGAA